MTEHQKILYWAFSKLRAASQSYDRSLQVERLASFVCIGIYGTAGAKTSCPYRKLGGAARKPSPRIETKILRQHLPV